MKYSFIIFTIVLGLLNGCKSININENNFLRNRSDTILYTMIRNENVTLDELVEKTGYKTKKIESSLQELLKNDLVTSTRINNAVVWRLSEKQLKEDVDYIDKVKKFSINYINDQLDDHVVTEHYFSDTGLFSLAILAKKPKVTIVFFGGNGFRINPEALEAIDKLANKNTNLFLMDYRGIGQSEGTVSVESMRNDSVAFVNFVQQQPNVKGTKLIYYGFSLGGFVATYASSIIEPNALILESTANNIAEWVEYNIPWYGRTLVNVNVSSELAELNNADLLTQLPIPVLILAGENDEVTSVAMSQNLSQSFKKNAVRELKIFEKSGHGDIGLQSDYKDVIDSFIDKIESK